MSLRTVADLLCLSTQGVYLLSSPRPINFVWGWFRSLPLMSFRTVADLLCLSTHCVYLLSSPRPINFVWLCIFFGEVIVITGFISWASVHSFLWLTSWSDRCYGRFLVYRLCGHLVHDRCYGRFLVYRLCGHLVHWPVGWTCDPSRLWFFHSASHLSWFWSFLAPLATLMLSPLLFVVEDQLFVASIRIQFNCSIQFGVYPTPVSFRCKFSFVFLASCWGRLSH